MSGSGCECPQQFPGLLLNSDVDRPLTLVLPPVLLEQVLANLILNAAQAGAKDAVD